jgi:hypothetical protein
MTELITTVGAWVADHLVLSLVATLAVGVVIALLIPADHE